MFECNVADLLVKAPAHVKCGPIDEILLETEDRMQKSADYLQRELGLKITMRIANDYAAVIEGQTSSMCAPRRRERSRSPSRSMRSRTAMAAAAATGFPL